MKLRNIKSAFTLGEILVTLAIVGTISAMTMPSLIMSYQKTAYATQLRKIYVEIGQAIDLLMTDEGKSSLNSTSLFRAQGGTIENSAGKFLKNYLKIAQDCGYQDGSTGAPCFASSYTTLKGEDARMYCPGYAVVTNAGYSICLDAPFDNGQSSIIPARLLVDVNGPKGPNIAGRDFFGMRIYSDGSIDEISPTDKVNLTSAELTTKRTEAAASCANKSNYDASGCFTKLLNSNWKMDY